MLIETAVSSSDIVHGVGHRWKSRIYTAINVTAACGRGCTASDGYWSQKRERKRTGQQTEKEPSAWMEIQGIIKDM